jgi:hypothetical protein
MDPVVLDAIFRSKKPAPGSVRIDNTVSSAGDVTVFMITAVVPGRPEAIPLADRDARKEQLESSAGASDYIAYVTELGQRASIERSDEALQGQDLFQ